MIFFWRKFVSLYLDSIALAEDVDGTTVAVSASSVTASATADVGSTVGLSSPSASSAQVMEKASSLYRFLSQAPLTPSGQRRRSRVVTE